MDAKIEPHRARSITYAILRNYKKKTAKLKKIGDKYKNLTDNLKLSNTKTILSSYAIPSGKVN